MFSQEEAGPSECSRDKALKIQEPAYFIVCGGSVCGGSVRRVGDKQVCVCV